MPTTIARRAPTHTEGVQSLRRAAAILRVLAASRDEGARLADVVAQCGLHPSTAHRILQVLVEEGLAERKSGPPRYMVGREASLLSLARPAVAPLRAVAEPFLAEICRRTGDTTVLTIRSGPDSICVERKLGSYPIQVLSVAPGVRRPLGVGVGGVMLLAALADDEVEGLLRANARRLSRFRTSPDQVLERVHAARKLRHAYSEAAVVPGTRSLAVAVAGRAQESLAAISVTAIAERLPKGRIRGLATLLHQQARALGAAWKALEPSATGLPRHGKRPR